MDQRFTYKQYEFHLVYLVLIDRSAGNLKQLYRRLNFSQLNSTKNLNKNFEFQSLMKKTFALQNYSCQLFA